MRDFRIVHARSILDVFSVAPIRGFNPPSIVVVGKDLNSTAEILYNGVLAPEFVVSSSTRLIVRIPPTQVGKDLTDFKVFASRPLQKKDASLILELSKPFQIVEGLDRLIQSWMIVFLTTPGSDVFTPSSGGGARNIVGSNTDRTQKSAAADLAVAIQRTESELIKLQAKSPSVPPEEKLLSASLDAVSFDDTTGTISARVQLKNMVNQSAAVSLG